MGIVATPQVPIVCYSKHLIARFESGPAINGTDQANHEADRRTRPGLAVRSLVV